MSLILGRPCRTIHRSRLADTHKVALVTKRSSKPAPAHGFRRIAAVLIRPMHRCPRSHPYRRRRPVFRQRHPLRGGERPTRHPGWLIDHGVPFTAGCQLGDRLTPHPRRPWPPAVIHVADATGVAVQATLTGGQGPPEHHHLRAAHRRRPRQDRRPARAACASYVPHRQGRGHHLRGHATSVLAFTGGTSARSEPCTPRTLDTATGDGVAMAWRSRDARVAKHGVHPVPPHLPVPPAGQVLPDLRGRACGEGGLLRRPDGSRLPNIDPRKSLPPRRGGPRHRLR